MKVKWLGVAVAAIVVACPALADTITVVTSFPNELTSAERRNDARIGIGARAIHTAIDQVLANPSPGTADLDGPLGTQAFASAVAARVAQLAGETVHAGS